MRPPTTRRGEPATSRPDRPTRPFAALPHDIAGRPDVSPTEKAVLLALLFWARAKAVCWPSDRSIGDRIGRSAGTVQRALRRLEVLGLVERRRVTTNATGRELVLRWRLTPEAPALDPPASTARDEGKNAENSKTPRTGPAERPAAAEREIDMAAEAAELRRLAECADLPPPIRRIAAANLARLIELAPGGAATGPQPDGSEAGFERVPTGDRQPPTGPPIRPVERSPGLPTAKPPLLPPRRVYGASRRSPWLEALARQMTLPSSARGPAPT